MQITEERRLELTENGGKFTVEELEAGYHLCENWRWLAIGPLDWELWGTDESECVCGYRPCRLKVKFTPVHYIKFYLLPICLLLLVVLVGIAFCALRKIYGFFS